MLCEPLRIMTPHISVHVETSVKTATRRNRELHASIGHHRSWPGAIRQNSVAPIRGIGVCVPAYALGCNLNPVLISIDTKRCPGSASSVFQQQWPGEFAFVRNIKGSFRRWTPSIGFCALASTPARELSNELWLGSQSFENPRLLVGHVPSTL